MSTRGTTHARLTRKVIILEGEDKGGKIRCGQPGCDNDGVMLHELRTNARQRGYGVQLERYVFCSERHRQMFLNQMRTGMVGRLPTGERGRIL